MSARLLGKEKGLNYRQSYAFAESAFALAKEYLPNSNFIFVGSHILCCADRVQFYNGNISGACVNGGGTYVKLYSYRVPCSEQDLYIYISDQYYYVTMKCTDSYGSRYVEFSFERELHTPFDRANIVSISDE